MNQFDVIQGFLECGETGSPSPDRLTVEFLKAVQALGFRHFACCSHVDPLQPPRDAVILHNYPPAWARAFSEAKLYEIDPVLKRAECSPLPFFWDSAFQAAPISKSQKRVLAEAAGYGLTHGYTVPIHLSWLPGTLRASCSVVPDSGRVETGSYFAVEAMATYLYVFATCTHAPWRAVTPVSLTSRERQCLALVAQGKTDWTIGRLLGLGESTAHYHVERVKRRYRVATRVQAAFLAFVEGQISFGDVIRKGGSVNPCADTVADEPLH